MGKGVFQETIVGQACSEKPWQALDSYDNEIYSILESELLRQREGLELIASENFASSAVIAAMGNVCTNKYAEGRPGKRYYGGCEQVDRLENVAIDRVCSLFSAKFANVQPHSGAQANAAVFLALANPGDVILGMDLSHGGHLTHGSPVNFSGLIYKACSYQVDLETQVIDYEKVAETARREKPKIIVAGASAYPRFIDFKRFREIADEVGAYLFVDMAHIAGLVAGGVHPSPLPHAHVVTSTTHKTLRGPRGGIILWNDADLSVKLNKGVFPGTQGGPLEHIIAAKAVCFKEAASNEFSLYQKSVVNNSQALAASLLSHGFKLVSGGTDNHLVQVNLLGQDVSGKELEEALEKVAITVNKNTVPGETRSPFVTSGLRLGTPAVTTRGLGVAEMELIGGWIAKVLECRLDGTRLEEIRGEVLECARKFPLYKGW